MTDPNWYGRLSRYVIKPGLCSGCGTCIALSGGRLAFDPVHAIPLPAEDTDHHFTADEMQTAFLACPGKGLDYPDLNRFVFGSVPENRLSGHVGRAYIGFSSDEKIRRAGASGGVITGILKWLLENHEVDGVITIRQRPEKPWLADPVIVSRSEDLIHSSQSVYFPVPVNAALSGIGEGEEVYAYVGLPDQVASLRALQQAGHEKANRIKWVIGPYMGINMYFGAVVSFLRSHGIKNVTDITYLKFRDGEWPGHLKIVTGSGKIFSAPKFYYNYLLPFYITTHSLLSTDFTNELSDISVGDAWHPKFEKEGKGYSVVLVRSTEGEALMNRLKDVIKLEEITSDQALDMHGHMIDFKKRGSFIRIGWRKSLGYPAPDWGYEPVSIPVPRKLVECVISLIFLIGSLTISRRIIGWLPVRFIGPLFNILRKGWKDVSMPTKRKGLREMRFREKRQYFFTLKGFRKRARQEYRYYTERPWTLTDVGNFWDTVQDYDVVNETLYTYYRRFTNSFDLADPLLGGTGYRMLDIQARSGKGSEFWFLKGKIASTVCVDFSAYLQGLATARLQGSGISFESIHITDLPLPFRDNEFDLVCSYETVEHVYDYRGFILELNRVMSAQGIMIITCPNVAWEWVHWLTAIININHSEGPHRFIRRQNLLKAFRDSGLAVVRENTTILLPFGNPLSVRANERMEACLPEWIKRRFGLRRTFILKKLADG